MNPEVIRIVQELAGQITWPTSIHWGRVALDVAIALIVLWNVVRRLRWENGAVFGLVRGLGRMTRTDVDLTGRITKKGNPWPAIVLGLPALILDVAALATTLSLWFGLRKKPAAAEKLMVELKADMSAARGELEKMKAEFGIEEE